MCVSWKNSSAHVIETKLTLEQFTDLLKKTLINWQPVNYIQHQYQ